MIKAESGPSGIEKAGKRLLALLALAATIVAIGALVSGSEGDGESIPPAIDDDSPAATDKNGPETPREYVIEDGDTLLGIADRYGISLMRIERLNPNLDTNTLATGDVLTLR